MEDRIALFMLKVSKFEFYLINKNTDLAHVRSHNGLEKVEGIDWQRLAATVEGKIPFSEFNFDVCRFGIFRGTVPQYLVKASDGRLKWDSDNDPIDSWERLLTRGFAQLRNNIAHGNKAQLPAPFTHDRTKQFLEGGEVLIDFLASQVFDDPVWETPIMFQ